MNKKAILIRLPEKLIKETRAYAKSTGRTISGVIFLSLKDYLEWQSKKQEATK